MTISGISCAMLAWAAWHLHLTLWVRSTLAARRAPTPRRYSWKVVMSEASCHSIYQQHRFWRAAASSRSAQTKIDHSENYRVTAKVGCYSDPQ